MKIIYFFQKKWKKNDNRCNPVCNLKGHTFTNAKNMNFKNKKYDEIENLLIAYICNDIGEKDKFFVENWLQQDQKNRDYFAFLQKNYISAQEKTATNKTEDAWKNVKLKYFQRQITANQQLKEQSNLRFIKLNTKFRISIAAAAVLLILFSTVLFQLLNSTDSKKDQLTFTEIVAPLGSKTLVNLQDGSKIWLNAGTKLIYNSQFSNSNREVTLDGEAYFEVAKSKNQFTVRTSDLEVKVYGTHFNITAYAEENLISTTLAKGSIGISFSGKEGVLKMQANQQAIFDKTTKKLKLHKNIYTGKFISWKNDEWYIENETLESLTRKLERKYAIKIIYENENCKKYKFTGTLTNETLGQILKLIEISAPVKYSIRGDSVLISENSKTKNKFKNVLKE